MARKPHRKRILAKVKNSELVEERHDQIFQAASKLIQKKGYHMTTLRDVSRETGIGLGNLYDYIGGKEDILYLIQAKTAQMINEDLNRMKRGVTNPVQRLKQIIETELDTMDKYQDLVMCIYQESHALNKPSLKSLLSQEEAHMGRFKEVLEEGIQSGVFKPFNTTMLANTIKMMIDAWVVRRWALRDKVGLKEMKRGIVEVVLNGIMTNENKQSQ
jgi:AcrR family transcriptional regulator